MRFCALQSGSNGNCTFIETGEYRILIDAGLSAKRMEELLRSRGIDPSTIDCLFITHEHVDHTRGIGVWMRRYHIPVFATGGTMAGMKAQLGKVEEDLLIRVERGRRYRLGDFVVEAVPTSHDAAEPCAYTVESGGSKASVITDTGITTPLIRRHLMESDIAVFESNYDEELLRIGPYPEQLKKRIAGPRGHLSNRECARALIEVRRYNTAGTVLLGHLSEENNLPDLAVQTVREIVLESGLEVGDISLTSREGATEMYRL